MTVGIDNTKGDVERITHPYAPGYVFASPAGPWLPAFAWLPRKMWDGRIVWMKRVWRQRMVVHSYLTLQGGGDFWRWTDIVHFTPPKDT